MLRWLATDGGALNVLRYITFRAACAAGFAFLLSVVFGPRLIRYLQRKRLGEDTTKSDSEKLNELHGTKRGTPTMGGLMLLAAVLASSALFAAANVLVLLATGAMLGMGLIGAVDDWVKLRTRKKGLSGRRKFALQWAVALCVGLAMHAHFSGPCSVQSAPGCGSGATAVLEAAERQTQDDDGPAGTALYFPFLKHAVWQMGLVFVLFAALVIVAASNAVNLTDGLDGLAAGCGVFVAGALAIASYVVGRADTSSYLLLPYVNGAGELSVVCAALLGALLGFLWFNCYPAQVFMGDTGALALGGGFGTIALATKQEFLLLMAGGIFVVETLSVILQVAGFRLTGRRILRIAPLHHHFEFAGQHENRVTTRLWIVAAFLALFALTTLKLR